MLLRQAEDSEATLEAGWALAKAEWPDSFGFFRTLIVTDEAVFRDVLVCSASSLMGFPLIGWLLAAVPACFLHAFWALPNALSACCFVVWFARAEIHLADLFESRNRNLASPAAFVLQPWTERALFRSTFRTVFVALVSAACETWNARLVAFVADQLLLALASVDLGSLATHVSFDPTAIRLWLRLRLLNLLLFRARKLPLFDLRLLF